MLANHSEYLLRSLGYEDLRPKFDSKHLLTTAQLLCPDRLADVDKNIGNLRVEQLGSSFIINQIYGIDYIANIINQHIAFSLTPYPNRVEEKLVKARNSSKLWQSLGISKFVVLLSIYPTTKTESMCYDKDNSQNQLLSVIFDITNSNQEVLSAEIHIQNEEY